MKFPKANLFDYVNYDWKPVQTLIDQGVSINAVSAAIDPTGLILSKRIINIAIQKGYIFQAFYHYGTQYPLSNPGGTVDYTATLITSGLTDNFNLTISTGGYISSNGGSNITSMGVCWSTSPGPTIANNTVPATVVASGGSFSSTITVLAAGTQIYVAAYATNVGGTSYGITQNIIPTTAPALTLVSVTQTSYSTPYLFTLVGNLTSSGGTTITAQGFVWYSAATPTLANYSSGTSITMGLYTATSVSFNQTGIPGNTVYVKAYATNSVNTTYSNQISQTVDMCLVKGTKVMLSDYSYKNIEDVEYSDSLLVWDFDEAKFDVSTPLWSKKPEKTNVYNWLKFSDGSELKTVSQHRIFNKEKGMFTYPMTPDTPVGTTTFNANGEEITLTSKEIVHGEVEYYNVITHKHINLFANTILTSCRYNNIYPIQNMRFIKDNRELRAREEFVNIPEKYIHGLRLNEQNIPLSEIEWYVNRLMEYEKIEELV